MKIKTLYRRAVQIGTAHDWRGRECLDAILGKAGAEAGQPGFDSDRLWNPYGDSRIAFGDPETEIQSVLVGINIRAQDLLLAHAMRQTGKHVDLALSHHTSCVNRGLYYFDDILLSHKYSLAEVGVPREACDEKVDAWIASVDYSWQTDTTHIARHLNIPFMNIHTPCDLLHVEHTRQTFARMKDARLADIVSELNRVEEIRLTPHEEVAVHGDPEARPGVVYNPTGAGWAPLPGIFEAACRAKINTAVLVSPSPEHLQLAHDYAVNIVELPHNSNDNHGINLMLDALQKDDPLTIYEAHNFRRVQR